MPRPDSRLPAGGPFSSAKGRASRGGAASIAEGRPAVSIVIPTRDRLALLLRGLEALVDQRDMDASLMEVIVVVDGSGDGTAARLRGLHGPFRLTVIERPHSGAAAARETGWRAARAPILLFLDDDVLADAALVREHLAAHAGGGNRVVLGALAAPPGRRSPWAAYEDRMQRKKNRRLAGAEVPSGIHYAGNLSLRRSALDQAGGFDLRLPSEAHIALGQRLARLGHEFVYAPAAVATHVGQVTLDTWVTRYVVQGRMDIALRRTAAYSGALEPVIACFHDRHPLTRLLLRLGLGSRDRERALRGALLATGARAHALGLGTASAAAFSACANLLYWSGVRDALRDNREFWRLVRATRGFAGRPYQLVGRVRRPT